MPTRDAQTAELKRVLEVGLGYVGLAGFAIPESASGTSASGLCAATRTPPSIPCAPCS